MNGVGMYFAPTAFSGGWGASVSTESEVAIAKFMGQSMVSLAIQAGAVAFCGKSVVQGLGYALAALTATAIDARFISRHVAKLSAGMAEEDDSAHMLAMNGIVLTYAALAAFVLL